MDLGAGSGVILLLLARRHPGLTGTGLEIQGSLAALAGRNVLLNRMADRLTVVRGDIRDVPRLFAPASFGTVVGNPPYRRPGTGLVSPHPEKGPARHELLVSLDDFLAAAAHLLAPGGSLFLCWKPERRHELAAAAAYGLTPVGLRPVRSREGDLPFLLLAAFRRGVPPRGTPVQLPPLTVYDGAGYAAETAGILAGGVSLAPLDADAPGR